MDAHVAAAYVQTAARRTTLTARFVCIQEACWSAQICSMSRWSYVFYGLQVGTVGEQAGSSRSTPVTSGRALAKLNCVPPLKAMV